MTKLPFDLQNRTMASVYPKGGRPALDAVPRSFSFVLNVARLRNLSSNAALLAPGHKLRKATEVEIEAIRDVLTTIAAASDFGPWQRGKPIVTGKKTTYAKIPARQWRYFVIAFTGSNDTSSQIERTLSITPLELKIGFTLLREAFPNAPMLIFSPARLFAQVQRAMHGKMPFLDVTAGDVRNIRLLNDQLQRYDFEPSNLKRLMEQMLDSDALPYDSPLRFLGYFAILESMLTHQPKKTDTIDSITRQVKQKVVLLNNRWQTPIDYSPFEDKKPETIWSAMYSYRSTLAHGGKPDFKDELRLLKDHDRALELLTRTVKSILRQAVIEPQLLFDLRNC
jgi:hypothetical protein